jgi:hypothetical protein
MHIAGFTACKSASDGERLYRAATSADAVKVFAGGIMLPIWFAVNGMVNCRTILKGQ